MASRSHGWFDEAQLLPAERLVRSGAALLRIPRPPDWWDGTLILTSDRLFFLPTVDHYRLGHTAFWLRELAATATGHHQISVSAHNEQATFYFGEAAAALIRDQAAPWLRAIASAQPHARPRSAFETPRRRAAG